MVMLKNLSCWLDKMPPDSRGDHLSMKDPGTKRRRSRGASLQDQTELIVA
jgi:hypothetical protein